MEEHNVHYVQLIYRALQATNLALSTMFNAGLRLFPHERDALIGGLSTLLDCFQKAATHAFSNGLTRFKLQPKFHSACEIKFKLLFEKKTRARSINPVAYATQLDEDFVGRLCAFSRVVSGRTLASKVIQRYKIAFRALWEKNGNGRSSAFYVFDLIHL